MRRHRIPPRHRAALLILAIAVLVPAVVVPLVLSGGPDGDPVGRGPVAGGSSSATTLATTPASTTGAPIIPATTPVVSGSKPEGGFTSLVFEAEAGHLRGATVVALDGGSGVRFTSQSGEIELEPVQVPTRDRYRVTIVYAAEGDWRLAVRGSANAEQLGLAGTAGCCASATVDVRISPGGSLSIEPSRGDGPLPTIDRILIQPA